MFNILGALSSMEREIIVERTRAGLVAAAARGRRGGHWPYIARVVGGLRPMGLPGRKERSIGESGAEG